MGKYIEENNVERESALKKLNFLLELIANPNLFGFPVLSRRFSLLFSNFSFTHFSQNSKIKALNSFHL